MSIEPLVPLAVIVAGAIVGVLAVVVRWRRGSGAWSAVRSLLALAAVVAITLDPAVGQAAATTVVTEADVLFVVDTTGSMAAEDYDGDRPRLDGVRVDLVDITTQFPGARYSLITFDATAELALPWTTDAAAFGAAVDVMRQEISYHSSGSRIDVARDEIAEALERSEESGADRLRVLVYISDGEQTAGGEPASFGDIADLVDAGAVLGYGTAEGGRMLEYWGVYGSDTNQEYIYDYDTAEDAISRIDEANLQQIADDLGVEYLHRTSPGGLDAWARTATDGAERSDGDSRDGARHVYWIPAIVLAALALWQLSSTASAVVEDRRMFPRPARAAEVAK